MSLLSILTTASLPTSLYDLFTLTPSTFTPPSLKKNYYKLALQYHPDRNSSEEAKVKFQAISAAYEVMSDPDRKANYDAYGLPSEGDDEDMSEVSFEALEA